MFIFKKRPFFLTLWALICLGCQPKEDVGITNDAITSFFDLEAYFQKEIERLEEEDASISKRIVLDGNQEQLNQDSIDFSDELSVFIKSDINRPAWSDKYQIDSIFEQNQLIGLHYEALSDRLKTRSIEIAFDKGEVAEINIKNLLKAVIATTDQALQYKPQTGYWIHNKQEIAFSKPQELKIEGLFKGIK